MKLPFDDYPNSKDFGARIRGYREFCGLSLHQLAAAADVSVSALHDVETKPSVRISAVQLYKLCRAMGCSMEHIMGVPQLPDYGNEAPNAVAAQNCKLKSQVDAIKRVLNRE